MGMCRACFHENPDFFKYCENCGDFMFYAIPNYCSNEDCRNYVNKVDLGDTGCYCHECGSKSQHYLNGYIHPIDHESIQIAWEERQTQANE